MTFTKGHPQYNSGRTHFKKGVRSNIAGEFKKGMVPKNFKKDGASRKAMDAWAKSKIPKTLGCELCGKGGRLEMSNKSHEYKRDVSDWQWICAKCHRNYDENSKKAWETRRKNGTDKIWRNQYASSN